MELTSISELCRQNIPGTLTVEYAPITWIDTDRFDDWYVTGADPDSFPWSDNQSWLVLPLLGSSIKWREDMEDTNEGPSFKHQLTGIIPHLNELAHLLLEETSRYPLVLKMTDKNGRSWILGTPDTPLRFSYAAENVDGSTNNYSIQMIGNSHRRARGFISN